MELTLCVAMIFAGIIDQYFMVPKRAVENRLADFAITLVWVLAGGFVGYVVPLAFHLTHTVTIPCIIAIVAFMLGVTTGRTILWFAESRARVVSRRAYHMVEHERGSRGR